MSSCPQPISRQIRLHNRRFTCIMLHQKNCLLNVSISDDRDVLTAKDPFLKLCVCKHMTCSKHRCHTKVISSALRQKEKIFTRVSENY